MGPRLQGKIVPILSMGRFAPTRIIPGSAVFVRLPAAGAATANFAASDFAGLRRT